MPGKRPYCLTIAGFDPSGGAGAIADCKTFEQLHTVGLSVLTANTIQTEDRFESVSWIAPEFIITQLELLLQRYPVSHFKIGLIENGDVLMDVLHTIHRFCKRPYILWDPILVPTAGGDLHTHRFSDKLSEILPLIQRITPNLPEYALLFGTQTPEEAAGCQLEIYLKGGHANPPGKDLLYCKQTVYPFLPQGSTSHTKHGTGCILSAAQLALTARRFPLVKTGLLAKRYLEHCLKSNDSLLAYHSR